HCTALDPAVQVNRHVAGASPVHLSGSRRRSVDQPRGTSAWQTVSITGTPPSKPRVAGSSPAGRISFTEGLRPSDSPARSLADALLQASARRRTAYGVIVIRPFLSGVGPKLRPRPTTLSSCVASPGPPAVCVVL